MKKEKKFKGKKWRTIKGNKIGTNKRRERIKEKKYCKREKNGSEWEESKVENKKVDKEK